MIDSWDTRQQGVKWNIFNAFNCSLASLGGRRNASTITSAASQKSDLGSIHNGESNEELQRERERIANSIVGQQSVAKMRNCLARYGIRFYQDSSSRMCLFLACFVICDVNVTFFAQIQKKIEPTQLF